VTLNYGLETSIAAERHGTIENCINTAAVTVFVAAASAAANDVDDVDDDDDG